MRPLILADDPTLEHCLSVPCPGNRPLRPTLTTPYDSGCPSMQHVLPSEERPVTRPCRLAIPALLAVACLANPFPPARADDAEKPERSRGYTIPLIDLAGQTRRQVIVDREAGQYLGHPTTVLLEDGKTIVCVYPKGHGAGAVVLKRSGDGGLTWSDRQPTPENWATSQETPTIHRVIDAQGKKRLIMFSGLYPIRMAVSEDDGHNWSPLEPIGDFGGVVAMSSVEPLRTGPGHYMALFHDDGRFLHGGPNKHRDSPAGTTTGTWTVYKTLSNDGGLTWGDPIPIAVSTDGPHLCEPGLVRSPDGKQIAVLLRENSRKDNSYVIFSDDEGETWTEPRELPGALTGDRHVGKYTPDGRLFISFRDTTHESSTKGDWVGWVGTYDDIVQGREGQYRVRLMDNHKGATAPTPASKSSPTAPSSRPPTATGPRGSRLTSSTSGSRSTSSTRWRRSKGQPRVRLGPRTPAPPKPPACSVGRESSNCSTVSPAASFSRINSTVIRPRQQPACPSSCSDRRRSRGSSHPSSKSLQAHDVSDASDHRDLPDSRLSRSHRAVGCG